MKPHGKEPRGLRPLPLSPHFEGRFGRLFRRLPPAPPLPEGDRAALAEAMREPPPEQGGGWGGAGTPPQDLDNPAIPAGYTYFGQFVDHDLTFDPASSLQREDDPDALTNFRTPRFDLDSVYGSGPDDEPFQYTKAEPRKLLIGASNGLEDLPRNSEGIALIGDPRNDENIIVSGLQLVFLKLHNKLFDEVMADATVPAERKFEESQQRVRWHYQWVVIHDYLRRLVGQPLIDRLFDVDASGDVDWRLRYYTPKKNAYMPVEFSVAAYRFGHSMVRPAYDLNDVVRDRPIFAPGDSVGELDDLRGFRPLPAQWFVEWRMFLQMQPDVAPQLSRTIDARLATGLFDLPGVPGEQPQSLALRNLIRGEVFGLPSGQDVAKLLGERVWSGAELGAPEPTPLWFYVLKESELTPVGEGDPGSVGRQLGPVGARIVAETLLGILRTDPKSYVNVNPTWAPTTIPKAGERFELADLVRYATT